MSVSDQKFVIELLRATAAGGMDEVKTLALEASRTARAEGDIAFADEVDSIFQAKFSLPVGLYKLKPKKTLEQLNLPPDVQTFVDDFLTEQRNSQALLAAGLDPRHKALFIGPPGNGKTVLAGAIATELGLPSFMVRYDDLISQKPGETSRNLLRIFDYARQQPTLLFFDEFDALGRERDDNQESGEMKRVVSTLLVQIDDIPSHVVAIAATNLGQMLDAAIWRRFNIRIELPRPRLDQFEGFMREMFQIYKHDPAGGADGLTLELVSYRCSFENFSDAELFVRNCVRLFVIQKGKGAPLTIEECVSAEVEKWSSGQKKIVA